MSTIKIICSIVLISFVVQSSNAQCDRNDPKSCPISNGYPMNCVCIPFGGGCWCECPSASEKINGECSAKPTKIGENCLFYSSCSNIEGAALCPVTSEHPKCECQPNLYPTNDRSSCIPSPKALDDLCSDAAPCDVVKGSSCQTSARKMAYFGLTDENSNEKCKCLPAMYPNFDGTSCHPAPAKIGDYCSTLNPCTKIPSSVCVQHGGEGVEPTCECKEEYSQSQDGARCLPTRIGVKCSEGSSCENLKGAMCFGSTEEARCLCLWSIPHPSMVKCFGH